MKLKTQMNAVTHKQRIEDDEDNVGNINSDTNDSFPINNKNDRKSTTVYPPYEIYASTNCPTERSYVGANASNRQLLCKSKPGGQIGPQKQGAKYMILDCVWDATQFLN